MVAAKKTVSSFSLISFLSFSSGVNFLALADLRGCHASMALAEPFDHFCRDYLQAPICAT
jgi:hypothetical protein